MCFEALEISYGAFESTFEADFGGSRRVRSWSSGSLPAWVQHRPGLQLYPHHLIRRRHHRQRHGRRRTRQRAPHLRTHSSDTRRERESTSVGLARPTAGVGPDPLLAWVSGRIFTVGVGLARPIAGVGLWSDLSARYSRQPWVSSRFFLLGLGSFWYFFTLICCSCSHFDFL
jgi:hypothetical protein